MGRTNALKTVARKALSLSIASAACGCMSFPKPMVEEMNSSPIELSSRDVLDKEQWKMLEDFLEGRIVSTFPFSFDKAGQNSVLTVSGVPIAKQEQEVDGIYNWSGEKQPLYIEPYTESMFILIRFTDPEGITFKNAYSISPQIYDYAWPSMSTRYGGWNSGCKRFLPSAYDSATAKVKGIEAFCYRKIPMQERKRLKVQ